jgi:hypothetical protein
VKARMHDAVRTSDDVQSDFAERVIPRGTAGTVVECYDEPEGYAVDLALPDERLVGGSTYVNVVLRPDQFDVVEPAPVTRQVRRQRHRRSPAAQRVPGGGPAPTRR